MERKSFHRWSNDELSYLRENYGKLFVSDISEKLGFSERKVIGKAFQLGLKSSLKKRSDSISDRIRQSGHQLVGTFVNTSDKTEFECKYCGKVFITTPNKIAMRHTKSCGCVAVGRRTGGKHISGTYYSHCLQSAKVRQLEFRLSIQDLDSLIEQQNGLCSLSGMQLKYGYRPLKEYTASLDRINPSIGYVIENVQFVHKDINMCKQSLSQDAFIEMCVNVTKYQFAGSY